MSLYRVVCDGIDILDYSSKDLVLLAPVLELEINTAGSLEFVMPPYHKYYDIIQIMTSTIEVYENDEIIWYGRPVEQKIDFFNQKKIYCEGPLSFFNDSVQRPEEYDNVNLYYFFDSVLQKHNDQVQKADRTFLIGNFTIDDATVYRNLNYESTYDVLQNQCLNTNDGYFFFRRQNGINYIDWLKDMPYTCNQVIRFGLNLLNYSSNFDAGEMATCVLPAGKVNSETDKALTIADVNGGSDILVSEAASTYGRIIKYQSWSDISNSYELMQEGRKYMENTQFNSLIIECSAADLHSKNAELENFRVGQMVHCLSEPHLIDRDFPISKISLALDSAAKIITLGIMKRKTLTRIYKNDVEQAQSYTPESYTPESYNPGVIEDENGDEWEIVLPEEDGDPITAQRMPTAIRVARMPNKTEYEPGEDLVWSGLVVQAMVDDKIWTNPPKYISGQILLDELTFSTKKAPKISEFSVDIMWTYKGKRYHTTMKLNVSKEASDEYYIDPSYLHCFDEEDLPIRFISGSFTVYNTSHTVRREVTGAEFGCIFNEFLYVYKRGENGVIHVKDTNLKTGKVTSDRDVNMLSSETYVTPINEVRWCCYPVLSGFDPDWSVFSQDQINHPHCDNYADPAIAYYDGYPVA